MHKYKNYRFAICMNKRNEISGDFQAAIRDSIIKLFERLKIKKTKSALFWEQEFFTTPNANLKKQRIFDKKNSLSFPTKSQNEKNEEINGGGKEEKRNMVKISEEPESDEDDEDTEVNEEESFRKTDEVFCQQKAEEQTGGIRCDAYEKEGRKNGAVGENKHIYGKKEPSKDIFNCNLREYQKECLAWMHLRENQHLKIYSNLLQTHRDQLSRSSHNSQEVDNIKESLSCELHPMWEEYELCKPVIIFFSHQPNCIYYHKSDAHHNNSYKSNVNCIAADLCNNIDDNNAGLYNDNIDTSAYSNNKIVYNHVYVNRVTGDLQLRFPCMSPDCKGGILADEMGLGKTVEMLSLIALDFYPRDKSHTDYCGNENVHSDLNNFDNKEFNNFLYNNNDNKNKTGNFYLMARDNSTKQTSNNKNKRKLHMSENDENNNLLKGGTLIILPLSLMNQWEREIKNYFKKDIIKVYQYYGQSKCKNARELSTYNIVLTTYNTVSSEYKVVSNKTNNQTNSLSSIAISSTSSSALSSSPLWMIKWGRIVLDEAHIIKNKYSQQCVAVCTLKGEKKWCLTATPIQNSLNDVYSLVHFLNIQPWSNSLWWNRFISSQLLKGETSVAIEGVRRICEPIMMRRTKATKDSNGEYIIKLPKKHVHILYLDMSSNEREFYDALFSKSKSQFDNILLNTGGNILMNYTHILQLLLRLRQTCCHPLLTFVRSNTKIIDSINEEFDALIMKLLKKGEKEIGVNISEEYIKQQIENIKLGNIEECPICLDACTDPVVCGCCHTFCRECALSMLKSKHKFCPICRLPIYEKDLRALPGASKLPKQILEKLIGCRTQRENVNSANIGDEEESGGNTEEKYNKADDSDFMYSTKLLQLKKMLEKDMRKNRHVIVFSQWTSFFDIIEEMLKIIKINYRRFDGTLTIENRKKCIEWFFEKELLDNDVLKQDNMTDVSEETELEEDETNEKYHCENNFEQTLNMGVVAKSEKEEGITQVISEASRNKEEVPQTVTDKNTELLKKIDKKETQEDLSSLSDFLYLADTENKNLFCTDKVDKISIALSIVKNQPNFPVKSIGNFPFNEKNNNQCQGSAAIEANTENKQYEQKSILEKVKPKSDSKIKRRWNGKVLLCSMKAGGVGLNLTVASRVYMMDLWWNAAVEEQAIQRVHRIGQDEEVHVFKFIMKKSVEERILQLNKNKELTAKKTLDFKEDDALNEGLRPGDETSNKHQAQKKLRIEELKMMFKTW